MSHRKRVEKRRLWTTAADLSQGDRPTIVTDRAQRSLTVSEAPVEVQQNPFPYDGLFVVLHDDTGREFSLLIPEQSNATPYLASPSDANGEAVHCIKVDEDSTIVGTTASDLGIPLR